MQYMTRVHDNITIIAAEEELHVTAKKSTLLRVLKIEHMISTETLSCTYSNWLAGN